MSKRLIGVVVGSSHVECVLLNQTDVKSFTLEDETKFNLQDGARSAAYNVIHGQLIDYVRQRKAVAVVIKGSAVSLRGTKLAHLEAAELRGVIQAAAAAAGVEVRIMSKAATSRSFGERKVDEYLKDNSYWNNIGLGSLQKGLREAAFTVVAEFSE